MVRIVETLGLPPEWLMHEAKHTDRFFRRAPAPPPQNNPHAHLAALPLPAAAALLGSSLSTTGGIGPFDLASSVPRHLAQQQQRQQAAAAAAAAAVAMGSSVTGGGGGGAFGGGGVALVPAQVQWVLLSQAEFEARNQCKAPVGKRYFHHTKLADIVAAYPMRPGLQVRAFAWAARCSTGLLPFAGRAEVL